MEGGQPILKGGNTKEKGDLKGQGGALVTLHQASFRFILTTNITIFVKRCELKLVECCTRWHVITLAGYE